MVNKIFFIMLFVLLWLNSESYTELIASRRRHRQVIISGSGCRRTECAHFGVESRVRSDGEHIGKNHEKFYLVECFRLSQYMFRKRV